jgi:arogenate dehydrogenase (NADP+), plant
MKKVTIIGFGRFGQTLYRLLKDDFEVIVYTSKKENYLKADFTSDLGKAYQSEVIFYAVPIQAFEEVIKNHKKYIREDHLLIDVLSVKLYPLNVFEKHLLGTKTQALLTHPIFGPDSAKDGFENLSIVIDKFKTSDQNYTFWKSFFKKMKLNVVEMSAREHDKLGADSLGLTHFLGRLLQEYNFKPTPIDPVGAKKFLEVEEQVCNDTWELFTNLQHYNPYTKQMRLKIGAAYDKLYNKLLPKQANPKYITIGIQGGIGSFNEEAVMHYIKRHDIKQYKIEYLHTTEKVLRALHTGDIDMGQFAIHNSVGGIVDESVEAMAKYKFSIVEEFEIIISHTLMIRKDAKLSEITQIMSHPQVFEQCKATLAKKYPHLELISGKGELIDHALVAKRLSEEKIGRNTATMGSKILADIYGLKVIEENLQDLKENYTSFLMVER